MNKNVNESDFEWADEIQKPYELNDIKVGNQYHWGPKPITITKTETHKKVEFDVTLPYFRIEFIYSDGESDATNSDIFLELLDKGEITPTTNINESDFDWTDSVPNNPVRWVEPSNTLENTPKDEDGWPIRDGDGEGEVWVDFERYSNDERIEIIHGIEEYLGTKLTIHEDGGNIYSCTSNQKKGLIVHCGHEDNHFFAQENYVCCMSETYDEFMEMERKENSTTAHRPNVDGGIFLNKENLTEGFYYKGVNPTVDLIVIRGDKVLLIQRGDDSEAEPGKWALPGGFHDTNAKEGEEWKEDKESSLEAAKREVKEETGLDVDSIKGLIFQMVGVFEGGGRDPRDKEDAWTRSTVYMVHIPEEEGQEVKGMDDAQRAEWVSIDKVLQHKLAFDHHKIIEKALSMNMNEAKEILKTLLTESDDLDWIKDVEFKVTDDYIKSLMSNCEDIPITSYNLRTKSPYLSRGKMNVFHYSMCPYWWDLLKDEPVDEYGRGKGEWFERSNPNDSVAVIMPGRNGVTDIRGMELNEYSAISYDLKGMSSQFNGERSELWIFLDGDGNLRYDLVPEHLVDEIKKGFEGVERMTTLEESFEWTEDIPDGIDFDLWEKVATDIDNEVSGPHSGDMRGLSTDLGKVLDKYNIDIDDMGEFFMAPPDGVRDKYGNHTTNYQLHALHKDLMKLGISLTPEQERELNLESVMESEFDWTDDAPDLNSHRFFDINVCYNSIIDDETGEDECMEGGSYFLKIPREVVPSIWDYEAEDGYIAGPGDEGYKVTQWCMDNGLLDDTDFDDVEYVTELDRSEYCRAWGDWQDEDKGLCHKSITESEFDWTEVSDPISVGMVFKVLGNEYPNQTLAKMVVTHVSNDEVRFLNQTNGLNPNGQELTITKQKALELIDDKYWVPVGENKYHYDKWRKDNGLTESEFDWASEHQPWEPGGKFVIDFTTEDEDVSGYLGMSERRRRSQMNDVLIELGYETNNMGLNHCFYYLEDFKGGKVDDEKWQVSVDDCNVSDLEYIYGIIRDEGYEILSPQQFFDITRGSVKKI